MNDAAYICKWCQKASALPSLNLEHELRCEMRPWEPTK